MAKTKSVKREKVKSSEGLDLSMNGIKEFVNFTKEFNISSLSIGHKGKKITVTKQLCAAPATIVEDKENVPVLDYKLESYEKIKSKFIGTFHPEKGVAIGKAVKKGAVVAVISSMRIKHEIKAEKDCTIKEVLVKENDPIEYGQPLYIIE